MSTIELLPEAQQAPLQEQPVQPADAQSLANQAVADQLEAQLDGAYSTLYRADAQGRLLNTNGELLVGEDGQINGEAAKSNRHTYFYESDGQKKVIARNVALALADKLNELRYSGATTPAPADAAPTDQLEADAAPRPKLEQLIDAWALAEYYGDDETAHAIIDELWDRIKQSAKITAPGTVPEGEEEIVFERIKEEMLERKGGLDTAPTPDGDAVADTPAGIPELSDDDRAALASLGEIATGSDDTDQTQATAPNTDTPAMGTIAGEPLPLQPERAPRPAMKLNERVRYISQRVYVDAVTPALSMIGRGGQAVYNKLIYRTNGEKRNKWVGVAAGVGVVAAAGALAWWAKMEPGSGSRMNLASGDSNAAKPKGWLPDFSGLMPRRTPSGNTSAEFDPGELPMMRVPAGAPTVTEAQAAAEAATAPVAVPGVPGSVNAGALSSAAEAVPGVPASASTGSAAVQQVIETVPVPTGNTFHLPEGFSLDAWPMANAPKLSSNPHELAQRTLDTYNQRMGTNFVWTPDTYFRVGGEGGRIINPAELHHYNEIMAELAEAAAG